MAQSALKYIGMFILLEGLFFNLMKISFPRKFVVWTVFIGNTLLAVPDFYETFKRMGVDYQAYIQQGGAVYHGERNYEFISSHQGHCYYPAGHLWHYYIVYWLHLQTPLAEYIMKMFFILSHSAVLALITKMAYLYFGDDDFDSAQMVGVVLLSNNYERSAFAHGMYNDQIMLTYLVLSMYMMLKNRPLISAFILTLGMSVKAGILLILPSFLGSIQYNYGTLTLLKSIFIIVVF